MDNHPDSSIDSINYFKVLGLETMSDEEKAAEVVSLSQEALVDVIENSLPLVTTEEELEKVSQLLSQQRDEEAMTLIKSKMPEFDEELKISMNLIKKDRIAANFETRRELLQFEWNTERAKENQNDNGEQLLQIQNKITTIEKILGAIEKDDWNAVSHLCEALHETKN